MSLTPSILGERKRKKRQNCCKQKFWREITEVLSPSDQQQQLSDVQLLPNIFFLFTCFILLLLCHPSSVITTGWSSPVCLKFEKRSGRDASKLLWICCHMSASYSKLQVLTQSITGVSLSHVFVCCCALRAWEWREKPSRRKASPETFFFLPLTWNLLHFLVLTVISLPSVSSYGLGLKIGFFLYMAYRENRFHRNAQLICNSNPKPSLNNRKE